MCVVIVPLTMYFVWGGGGDASEAHHRTPFEVSLWSSGSEHLSGAKSEVEGS
jgi:hypothetical protein